MARVLHVLLNIPVVTERNLHLDLIDTLKYGSEPVLGPISFGLVRDEVEVAHI